MASRPLTIVIAGGGTGGHLYPGIAVARELLARRPDARISFAGTAKGIESRVVPREGFALDLIRSGGLKGKSLVDRLRGAWLLPLGLLDAWRIVSNRRPDLVIGVGGYSSGPVVLVAWLRGVPTMLLEQNAVPGLTNRLLARFVRAAAVTFESTKEFFRGKAFVSGNPVRPEFPRRRPNRQRRHVQMGGDHEGSSLWRLPGRARDQRGHGGGGGGAGGRRFASSSHAHQTGERDVEMVRAAYRAAGLQADVEPFLYDMGRQLGQADLVVCRAGATTLAEITAAGKAAILIPLPTATDDHQRQERRRAGGGRRQMCCCSKS